MTEAPEKRAYLFSFGLHGVALAALGVGVLLESCSREPEPYVFELLPPPSAQVYDQPQPDPVPPTETPAIQNPDVPEREAPRVRDVPRLERPVPEPVREAPQPTPRPQPQPAPPEPRERMSFEDYARQHGRPEPRERSTRQERREVEAPRLDTSEISQRLRSILVTQARPQEAPPTRQNTQAEADALQRYMSILVTRLDAAFRPPPELRGQNLEASVELTIDSAGRIAGVRLARSSGNSAFDAAAVAAVRAITSPGPPPGNPPYTFGVPFRMRDSAR